MSVTTRQKDGRTVITVADRGPGVDPALRGEVFQPFRRGDHGVSGVAGTGIGLSIARQLARLHGGDVTLIETPQGATFQVELATPEAAGEDTPCTS
jgi:signal transduction histidine kinase